MAQTLINLVPQNPFAAAAQGGADLLPLIVAVCFFGAAATVIETHRREPVVRFFQGVNEMAMVVVGWLMQLAPFGVFALIAAAVAKAGVGLLDQLLAFAAVVVVALVVHVAVTLIPMLRFGAREPVGGFLERTSDALFLAFSTASSNATLPVSMAAANDRLGVPSDITSFVLPAGASLNKNGSAAYKAVTAVFIAHLYGFPVTPSMMLTIVAMATIAAFAGAGVPGQLARHDADRAERDRTRLARRRRHRARRRDRPPARHVPVGGEHVEQSRWSNVDRAHGARRRHRHGAYRPSDDRSYSRRGLERMTMVRGKTLSEKILSAKSGVDARAGDVVVCDVDLVIGTDASTPMTIDYFEQMGGERLFDAIASCSRSTTTRRRPRPGPRRFTTRFAHSRDATARRCSRSAKESATRSHRSAGASPRRSRHRRRQSHRDVRRAQRVRDRRRLV